MTEDLGWILAVLNIIAIVGGAFYLVGGLGAKLGMVADALKKLEALFIDHERRLSRLEGHDE